MNAYEICLRLFKSLNVAYIEDRKNQEVGTPPHLSMDLSTSTIEVHFDGVIFYSKALRTTPSTIQLTFKALNYLGHIPRHVSLGILLTFYQILLLNKIKVF